MKQTITQEVFLYLVRAIHANVFPATQDPTFDRIRKEFVEEMQMRFQNASDGRSVLIWRCYDACFNVAFPIDSKIRISEIGIYQQRQIIPLERFFEGEVDGKEKISVIRKDVKKIKKMLQDIDFDIDKYCK